MSIKQLTVFVENKQGAVIPITEILSENNNEKVDVDE